MSKPDNHDEAGIGGAGRAPEPKFADLPAATPEARAAGPEAPNPRDAVTTPRADVVKVLLQLPALIGISLYMLILAGAIVVGVGSGGHYPPLFLVLAAGFIAASAGLMRLKRWAWALTLAAVLLLALYNLWIFKSAHMLPGLVQGLLNFVFFLYLVRAEVREQLR